MKEAFDLIHDKLDELAEEARNFEPNTLVVSLGKMGSFMYKVEAEYGKDINVRGNGWIPVEKALPKECVPVLVCNADGKVYIRQINWVARASVEIPFWSQNSTGIIAWMPLPEPYKPEKGAQDGR